MRELQNEVLVNYRSHSRTRGFLHSEGEAGGKVVSLKFTPPREYIEKIEFFFSYFVEKSFN